MMSQTNFSLSTIIIPFSLLLLLPLISAGHVINFRSPSLYPESVTYDSVSQHFVVGSLNHRTLVSISDAGVTDTLFTDENLPENASIVGVTIDRPTRRLLATIHSVSPLPPFSAVAAYSLRSPRTRLFLAPLPESTIASDVAVDYDGNAYVTDSAGNVIWKITPDGAATVFSKSPAFTSHLIEQNKPYSSTGLNGIIFISKGYLLVVQSNTGKMYKVDIKDGYARTVILNKDLTAADDIAVRRRDGVVVVVSQYKVYFIKSADSWAEGVVFDETALDSSRFATSVAVGADDRVYVLYGHVDEGILGNSQRENFSLVEIGSEKESKEDAVWVYVLIGFGFAYFCFWRFQMKHLYTNMNKKIA